MKSFHYCSYLQSQTFLQYPHHWLERANFSSFGKNHPEQLQTLINNCHTPRLYLGFVTFDRKCLSILYFLALTSVGIGSVPHSIYCNIVQMDLKSNVHTLNIILWNSSSSSFSSLNLSSTSWQKSGKKIYPFLNKSMKYQPTGEGGTRSPPATPHHLQNPKWPPGGPIMVEGVWKGVYP